MMLNRQVELTRLGGVVDWLDQAGVPLTRIAAVTGTSYANVRTILSRHRRRTLRPLRSTRDLNKWQWVGEPTDRRISDQKTHDFDRLRGQICSIVADTWSRSDFEWGIGQLTGLGQYFGHFSHPVMTETLGLQQLHLSFFNVHLGRTRSALAHGHLALRLFENVAKASSRHPVSSIIEALGAIAHAHLLAQTPRQALALIEQMERLHWQHHVPTLPEFFRKRGVAYLQLSGSHEGEAKRAFGEAARAPSSGADPLEHKMMSQRHLNLLTVDCDHAAELAQEAGDFYGQNALQRSMCVNWYAAAALVTDSKVQYRQALTALENNANLARAFGHQATVTYLLSKTNELPVPLRFRREWVRLALYSNAFRTD